MRHAVRATELSLRCWLLLISRMVTMLFEAPQTGCKLAVAPKRPGLKTTTPGSCCIVLIFIAALLARGVTTVISSVVDFRKTFLFYLFETLPCFVILKTLPYI